MPLFEYRCESCGHRFEALIQGSQKPACARCGAKKLEKLISAFAVAGGSSARESAAMDGSCGSCGDPRGPGSCRFSGD